VLVGLLCAVAAAVATGAGSVLQSLGARRAVATAGLVAGLRRQPLYFLGLGSDLVGFAGSVVALQSLPLFLVQGVVASNVAVVALLSALLGARPPRATWLWLTVVLAGLVLLAGSAQADDATPLPESWRWVLPACVLPALALGWWGRRSGRAGVLAIAAGLAYSTVAVTARSLEPPHPLVAVLADPALWSLAVNGLTGTLLFAAATQLAPVTRVTVITFSAQTVVPSVVGILVLGDSVRAGAGPVAAVGFLLAVGGALLVSRVTEPVPVAVAPAARFPDPDGAPPGRSGRA
jgi:hypothetical protein